MINMIRMIQMVKVLSDSSEDWTKFCLRMSWQNLVWSSLPSFLWLPVGRIGSNFAHTWSGKIWSNPLCLVPVGSHSREDWSKFCPRMSWQNLVRSPLSSFHLVTSKKYQQRGLDQILSARRPAKFGSIVSLSAVVSLVTGRKWQKRGLDQILPTSCSLNFFKICSHYFLTHLCYLCRVRSLGFRGLRFRFRV